MIRPTPGHKLGVRAPLDDLTTLEDVFVELTHPDQI